MAEVENMSAATASAADIPKLSSNDGGAAELGTSPAQERSSNSHPHDSEYDTASDLEGGEHDDYDDDDDEEDDEGDESLSDEDDDDDDEDDDEEEDTDENRQRGTEGGTDKADDVQKKVDEDRSNPQYIPKRGTFYEHDDRTAEGAEGAPVQAVDAAEDSEVNGTNPQSPTAISHASKTMKKWQPASGVDRWSHDRFDPNEQAPKSRSELVSAYGYDIRNEDAPPRARRRRRYGKGPSKYSRNWEDETAYLKASNTPRRPPRPSDFPALNERKPRKTNSVKEEKENHLDRRQVPDGEKTTTNSAEVPQQRTSRSGERRERDPQRKGSNNKNKTFGRNQPVGRQAAMEFKNKQRPNHSQGGHGPSPNTPQNRLEQQKTERNQPRSQNSQSNDEMRSSDKPQSKHVHPQQNDANETPYVKVDQGQKQSNQHVQSSNHNARNQPKSLPASNLSARLQQLQNRNDPSHVGSVQMHALANHNQLVGQQQQANLMLAHQQQQQQQQLPVSTATNHPDQGRPKRYSSIRRSQHDTQNIDQQHQMQQLHMQQQQQVAPQPILIQDQHMLQANLMQLYHQENLQAQMQALQVSAGLQAGAPSQQPGPQKPPTYATVPPAAQQPPQPPQYAAAGAGGAPTAYYVAAPEAYAATAVAGQAPPPAQYPQPPTGYIQGTPAPTGPPIAYASPPPQQAVGATAGVAPVVPLAYGGPNPVPGSAPAPANAAPPTAGQPGYQNYANYQNYNTVGGTTYFVPPAQATTRPVVLPQRRPTNAIPILPPSEKSKQRSQPEGKEDQSKNSNVSSTSATGPEAPLGSAENIDHIIDNMFVQRPAYQPPPTQARKSTSPPPPVKEDAPSASGGGDSNSGPTPAPAQSTSNTSQAEEVPNEKQSNIEPADSNNAAVAKEAI